jgi:hypothetical protein
MNSDKARERAEKSFRKEERAQDGRKAMIEYESQARATREKTARLKELRLAREGRGAIDNSSLNSARTRAGCDLKLRTKLDRSSAALRLAMPRCESYTKMNTCRCLPPPRFVEESPVSSTTRSSL